MPAPLSGQQTVRSAGLEVRVQYPAGWTVVQMPVYALALRDPSGTRSLTVMTPIQAPFRMDARMSSDQLKQITSALSAANASVASLASGQAQLADGRFWIWFESDAPVAQSDWNLSPADVQNYDKARIWTFVTTAGGQFLAIHCGALVTRGATPDAGEAQLSRARGECGSIMQTLAIQTP